MLIMSKMSKLPYPPCKMNPMTEKPYNRHKWTIPAKGNVRARLKGEDVVYYDRIVCSRCGLNDPNPTTH